MFGVTEEKKKFNYKKIIMVIIILIVLFFVGMVVFKLITGNKSVYNEKIDLSSYKDDMALDYVYDAYYYPETDFSGAISIPAININTIDIGSINDKFVNIYKENSNKDSFYYNYGYSINGAILSIYVGYGYIDSPYPVAKFISYNIDVIKGKILTDADILKKYNLNSKQVSNFLSSKFSNMYNEMVKKNYLNSGYTFGEFVRDREILNYLDNICYYIDKKGSLIVFKSFNRFYGKNDVKYFDNDSYKFVVVDGDK